MLAMPAPDANPAYRIETQRLVVRPWSPADGPQLRATLDEIDAHLRPWIPWMRDEPASLAATVSRLRKYRAAFDLDQDYRYAVMDASETRLLGETGLYTRVGPNAREIGYWTHAHHTGLGYAEEAAAAMVKVAFEIDGVARIEIHCAPENVASTRIPLKLGFTHEATLSRRIQDTEGDIRSLMIWTLFDEDYARSPAASAQIRAFDATGARLL